MAALMTTGVLVLLSAISLSAGELSSGPIKWFDADNKHIPEPAEIVENQVCGYRRPHAVLPDWQAPRSRLDGEAHRQHPECGPTQRSGQHERPG